MLRGLDVSANQGVIDWPRAAVALDLHFVWIKCSEGNRGTDPIFQLPGYEVDHDRATGVTGRDPQFDNNVRGARAAGLRVGPYHFAYPLPDDGQHPMRSPADQAKFAFDHAGGLGSITGDLPPALDFEWPEPKDQGKWGCDDRQLRTWALDCLEAAEGFWGCPVVFYTYEDFWLHMHADREPAFARHPLWLAHYPRVAHWPNVTEVPRPLAPWSRTTIWQFTGGGMPIGSVPADFDVFLGDQDDLDRLCTQGSTTDTDPPPALAA